MNESNKTDNQTVNDIFATLENICFSMGNACGVNSVSNIKNNVYNDSKTICELDKMSIDSFEHIKTIGTGSFSNVKLSKSLETGQYYAIKSVSINKLCRLRQSTYLINSRKVLMKIKNSSLHSSFFPDFIATAHDDINVYFINEYIQGGELFELVQAKKYLQNKEVIFYGAEMVSALNFLHDNGIIYRELIPENVLIDSNGHIKLCGSTYAKILDTHHENFEEASSSSIFFQSDSTVSHLKFIREKTFSICGTPEYMSPEMLKGKGYTIKTDYWGLGIILYEMLHGFTPFYDALDDDNITNQEEASTELLLFKRIISKKFIFKPTIHKLAKDLIKKLLTGERRRLGRSGILDHKYWFINGTFQWSDVDHSKDIFSRVHYKPAVSHDGDFSNFKKYDEIECFEKATSVQLALFQEF